MLPEVALIIKLEAPSILSEPLAWIKIPFPDTAANPPTSLKVIC